MCACICVRRCRYIKVQPLVLDLANTANALRDRHWSWLMKQTGVHWDIPKLTLVHSPLDAAAEREAREI